MECTVYTHPIDRIVTSHRQNAHIPSTECSHPIDRIFTYRLQKNSYKIKRTRSIYLQDIILFYIECDNSVDWICIFFQWYVFILSIGYCNIFKGYDHTVNGMLSFCRWDVSILSMGRDNSVDGMCTNCALKKLCIKTIYINYIYNH